MYATITYIDGTETIVLIKSFERYTKTNAALRDMDDVEYVINIIDTEEAIKELTDLFNNFSSSNIHLYQREDKTYYI